MVTSIHAGELRSTIKAMDFTALAGEHSAPCISIYANYATLGTGASAAKQQWLQIRNLLRTAEAGLSEFSMPLDQAESLLSGAWHALQEEEPFHVAAHALALFVSQDSFSYCHLSEPVNEQVIVGREFFIRPLLALVPRDDRFFVLTLSQNHVKLYEGSASGMRERPLPRAPENLREDLEAHAFERQYQLHTASPAASGQKGAVFHGPSLDEKEKITHYLRDVDRGVALARNGQQAPLILAAVDYLIPIYRSVSTCAHLADEAIVGNPDQISPSELFSEAWKIVERHISKHEESAFAVYREHANTPLTSSNLREVLGAADRGLVRFLFVSPSGEQWGSIAAPEKVHVHSTREPGDAELLNLAAILAIRHGGQVFVASPEQLSEGAKAAAVFRFPLAAGNVGSA